MNNRSGDLYPLISVLHDMNVALRSYNAARILVIADLLTLELRSTLPVQLLIARAHLENGDYQQVLLLRNDNFNKYDRHNLVKKNFAIFLFRNFL